MIKKEFANIFKNKSVMLLLVAIVLIPFAYSFCFLTSAWDPYGNTGKIPVAVVNHDVPTELQGKKINVGEQTIHNLKDDNQLGWHFVSAKQAAEGLKNNKYYTVVTIPKNFSKDAATVLDPKPKQMKLTYKTNGSLNYVSEIISQVGTDKLNEQIRAKVTNAFASTLFAQVGQIGKKIGKAASGATQINSGMVTLDNGVNQYTVGVSKVNNGLQKLQVAVDPLSSGVQQLANGSTKLEGGLAQLQSKVPALTSGVDQLYNGMGQLNSKMPALTAGVNKLNDGMGQLNGQVPALADGVSKLNNGSGQVTDGLTALNKKTLTLPGGVQKLTDGIGQIQNGLGQIVAQAPTLAGGVNQLAGGVAQYTGGTDQLADGVQELKKQLVDEKQLPQKVDKLASTVQTQAGTISLAQGQIAKGNYGLVNAIVPTQLKGATTEEKGATTQAQTAVADNTAALEQMQKAIDQTQDANAKKALEDSYAQLEKTSTKVQTGLEATSGVVDAVNHQINTTATDAEGDPAGLKSAVSTLNSGVNAKSGQSLTSALNQLADGSKQLEANSGALNSGASQLSSAVPTLVAALQQLYAGSGQEAAGLADLNTQAPQLAAGVTQLMGGSGQVTTGLNQLNGKVPALKAGVSQLYGGTSQLAAQTPALASGVGQLYNGMGQLHAQVPALASGVNQLHDGSKQLSDGLNQLNSKTPELKSGVNQLADGASQLDSKSGQLTDGTSKLKDGSGQLADGLVAGQKQINGVHLTKATAKMFAAPSRTEQKRLTTVPNYGDALAPYVLALALFIAVIIFNFTYPMRRHDGYKSVAEWFKAKMAVGTLVAVAMAMIEATLMLIVGLHVDNIVQFYGITVLFALAAMYMTQFLNLAFGGVGIFVALGLLTLSGSGGLFPAETISPLYDAFQRFLPMTYAINGYRNAISGGISTTTVTTSVIILIAIAVCSVALMFPAIKHLLGRLEQEEKS
ncbi:YhgE/Pip domain-containing protein [Lacticaseibacillus zhaodongensis]|uniref:YhgE/Pip domain-containing protein n=1 Tax=Lacticaseibacillus zhaodongensis TaxID=2668065 RepID=UPI0018AFE886|nr:YhgE/Pip domain-containing protein [Lacticaseibacillus zhaodongensis]